MCQRRRAAVGAGVQSSRRSFLVDQFLRLGIADSCRVPRDRSPHPAERAPSGENCQASRARPWGVPSSPQRERKRREPRARKDPSVVRLPDSTRCGVGPVANSTSASARAESDDAIYRTGSQNRARPCRQVAALFPARRDQRSTSALSDRRKFRTRLQTRSADERPRGPTLRSQPKPRLEPTQPVAPRTRR